MFFKVQILLFLFISMAAFSQDIVIGKKCVLESEVLGEERELWISLPESYNDTTYFPANYPVMYLLDPDFYFQSTVAIHHALAKGYYNYMQEMIIVGIVNTDRSRDLTPTRSPMVHAGRTMHGSSGGAGNFFSFIQDELKPYIDSHYRTSGYSILNGHSFGGLFALSTLINHPRSFQAYIAHDPSLWWDNKLVFRQAQERWEQLDLSGVVLYLSMANYDKEAKDRLEHSQTIQMFNRKILQQKASKGLRCNFAFYEKENHGTVFIPATYDALRYIYNGICLPVKEIPRHPEGIEQTYQALSDSLCFEVIPPENIVDNMGNYALELNQIESAVKIFRMNTQNYPSSAHAHFQLGKALLLSKANKESDAEFKKAIGLNPAYKNMKR